jgi:hypothetical protein
MRASDQLLDVRWNQGDTPLTGSPLSKNADNDLLFVCGHGFTEG